jgi:hypothetical protein
MGIFGALMGLLNLILGRSDRWGDKTSEQRRRVAAYLRAVSDCLVQVAAELRAHGRAYSGCAELAHYALGLPEVVESELGAEGELLLEELRRASSDRMALVKGVKDPDEAQEKLALMEVIAGKIKGLSVSLGA